MKIRKLEKKDLGEVGKIFELSLKNIFKTEGLEDFDDELKKTIKEKKNLIEENFQKNNKKNNFFIIKNENKIVAVGAYGEVTDFLKNVKSVDFKKTVEIHSFYVLPESQGNGFGRKLLEKIILEIKKDKNIKYFSLYSGFKKSQKFWEEKLGKPFYVDKNRWGKGANNFIWKIKSGDLK